MAKPTWATTKPSLLTSCVTFHIRIWKQTKHVVVIHMKTINLVHSFEKVTHRVTPLTGTQLGAWAD